MKNKIFHEITNTHYQHYSQEVTTKNQFWLEVDKRGIHLFCSVVCGCEGLRVYKMKDLGTAIQEMVYLNNYYRKAFKKLDKFVVEMTELGYKGIH